MSINDQPMPIIIHIFKYLTYVEHFELRSVCIFFKSIIDSIQISGVEPNNIYDCMLTDNIYYFKFYQKKILERVSNQYQKYIITNYGSDKYIDKIQCKHVHSKYQTMNITSDILYLAAYNNLSEVFYDFYSIFMPNARIKKICNKPIFSCSSANHKSVLCTASINFLLQQVTFVGDLRILIKLNTIVKIFNRQEYINYILIYASIYGYLDIVKYILEEYFASVKDELKHELLIYAIENNHCALVMYILQNHSCALNIIMSKIMINRSSLKCIYQNKYIHDKLIPYVPNIFIYKIKQNKINIINTMLKMDPSLINCVDHKLLKEIIHQHSYKMIDLLIKYNVDMSNIKYIRHKFLFRLLKIFVCFVAVCICVTPFIILFTIKN